MIKKMDDEEFLEFQKREIQRDIDSSKVIEIYNNHTEEQEAELQRMGNILNWADSLAKGVIGGLNKGIGYWMACYLLQFGYDIVKVDK